MPQVRRIQKSSSATRLHVAIRHYLWRAALTLATLLGVSHAHAQSTGAAAAPAAQPVPPATPVAAQPAATPPAAAPPNAPQPAATMPAAAMPVAAQPAAPPDFAARPTPSAQGPISGPYSPEPDQDTSLLPLRDQAAQKPPSSARWLLIATGAATTGLFYAGAYGIGQIWPDAPGRHDLKYPVAGPIMDLAHTGCPADDSDCSRFQLVVRTAIITLDAIGQIGGVALMFQGAILGTASVDAPRGAGSARLHRPSDSIAVVPVPWVDGRSGGGLSLAGRF